MTTTRFHPVDLVPSVAEAGGGDKPAAVMRSLPVLARRDWMVSVW
jgi:hypothetical protein